MLSKAFSWKLTFCFPVSKKRLSGLVRQKLFRGLRITKLVRWAHKPFASKKYLVLTTTGRRTGREHCVILPYVESKGTFFVVSGYFYKSDWVKNILKNPSVKVKLNHRELQARAHLAEEESIRMMVAENYVKKTYPKFLKIMFGKRIERRFFKEALKRPVIEIGTI